MQLLVNHFLVAEIFMTSHTRKLAPWDPLLWLSTAKIESRQLWTILLNAFCLTTQGISCSAKWSSNILDHPSRQTVTGLTCWQQNTFMDCAGYEEQFTSKYNETDNNKTDILLEKPKGKNYLHWYQRYHNQSIKVKKNNIWIKKMLHYPLKFHCENFGKIQSL